MVQFAVDVVGVHAYSPPRVRRAAAAGVAAALATTVLGIFHSVEAAADVLILVTAPCRFLAPLIDPGLGRAAARDLDLHLPVSAVNDSMDSAWKSPASDSSPAVPCWRPTTLEVTVRRYRCTGCDHVWRQDTSKVAEPRARLSRSALRWAFEAIVVQHLTVARIAEALAVAWDTANDAVLAEGKRS